VFKKTLFQRLSPLSKCAYCCQLSARLEAAIQGAFIGMDGVFAESKNSAEKNTIFSHAHQYLFELKLTYSKKCLGQ
jgi:hypothetical protein